MAIDLEQNTRLKGWIRHKSGSINQKGGVFNWRTRGQRETNMRTYINRILTQYRGEPIEEVRFYDKMNGNAWVATWKPGDANATWFVDCI